MDEQQIREIRQRAERAAKGPWYTQDQIDNDGVCVTIEVFGGEKGHFLFGIETDTDDALENAEFVVHARDDTLAALDALAERAAEVARLREALERCRAECEGIEIGVMGLVGRIADAALAAPPPGDGAGGGEA